MAEPKSFRLPTPPFWEQLFLHGIAAVGCLVLLVQPNAANGQRGRRNWIQMHGMAAAFGYWIL